MPLPIAAERLKSWLADGDELAILDAREEGEFGGGHLFWAVPCPLSRAPLLVRALLPRLSVRLVVTDGGDGAAAETLAAYLEDIGCTDVSLLTGGVAAWKDAGFEVFSGVNVPSKAFGEWVEHQYGTPSIQPAELKALMEAKADMVVLDSRPMEEFRAMSIPGAIDVPGGELAWRIGGLAPRAETLVVVNCAGRTRSILGAESLRQAGIPNRVMALRDGTMGWELAGFACDRGESKRYPEGAPPDAGSRLAAAQVFAKAQGVEVIDMAGLAALRRDARHSTYLLDVRDLGEYLEGHLPGARPAPGGQLVQAVDRFVAVRHARLVLVDGGAAGGDGVRARMTAAWLRQLGRWRVLVLDDMAGQKLVTGPPPVDCPEAMGVEAPSLSPEELAAAMTVGNVAVLDLRRSIEFRAGHVFGAVWGIRTRLEALAAALAGRRRVVVVGDAALARLALPEIAMLAPGAELGILAGGQEAWRRAGMPVEKGGLADEACLDVHLRPYDRAAGVEAAMRDYLAWEIALMAAVKRDGDAPFGHW